MADNNYTIVEKYTLPSKGLIYSTPINPDVSLRSMRTCDEMKRLSATGYAGLCDMIEDCMIEKPQIHVYDMCLGDYQFLLHKLRVVTYGPDYKMTLKCPICGEKFDTNCNLDELEVIEYTKDVEDLKHIKLPVCGKDIELRIQTPRILDENEKEKKERLKRNPNSLVDPGYLLTLIGTIKSIDGRVLSPVDVEDFVRNMNMRDANALLRQAGKLNESVGLNTMFTAKCPSCNFEMESQFRITSEFFGPTTD